VLRIEIPASFQQLANLQLAAASGPVWMQAEWYGTWIDQIGGPPIFFHGCHVDSGWFLTGEQRAFDAYGVWGAIRVNRPVLACCACDDRQRGWGAWELTARFSYLDFFDADTPLGPAGQLQGIQLPEATFGVNWYLADQMRCMFNYTYAVPDEPNAGTSAASTFALRLAWYW
jgi:phosphate-selective porin OprO/OprP